MLPNLQEKIKRHNEKISSQNCPTKKTCLKCAQIPEHFQRHDCRVRLVWIIVEREVLRVEVLLLRFKCRVCSGTFTEYPDFMIPYKRYAASEMVEMGWEFVSQKKLGYREAVSIGGMPVGHESKELETEIEGVFVRQESNAGRVGQETVGSKEESKGKFLSHSTLWRSLGYWGEKEGYLNRILSLLGQKGVESEFFRKLQRPIPEKKYRSEARKKILETFTKLYLSAKEFAKEFGLKIFPHFETP